MKPSDFVRPFLPYAHTPEKATDISAIAIWAQVALESLAKRIEKEILLFPKP